MLEGYLDVSLPEMPKLRLLPALLTRTDVILVGSELTEASDEALSHALYLASKLGKSVLLIHVFGHVAVHASHKRGLVRADFLALRRLADAEKVVAQQKMARQLRRGGAQAADVTLEVPPGRTAKELLGTPAVL